VTTKESLPVAVVTGPANQHEGRKLIPVMESISVKHGRGRPRRRPKVLYADTKYNMPLNKFYLDDKHVKSQMPDKPGKKKRAGRKTEGVRQESVQSHQVDDRAIQRMDQGVQEGRDEIRQTTTGLHGRIPCSVHHGLPQGIAMSSKTRILKFSTILNLPQ
jgi:hypothetical protein